MFTDVNMIITMKSEVRHMFGRRVLRPVTKTAGTTEENTARLKQVLDEADAVVIGAGSGLSTAAGFTYAGQRFEKYFSDFAEKFGIRDMYSGGFYPFPDLETFWAWWSRALWINRYVKAPGPVYDELLNLVEDKDYFVITTNVASRTMIRPFAA